MSLAVLTTQRDWTYVCRVEDLPRRGGRVARVGRREVSLFRTSHGGILATENRCPHRGGKLSEGIVTGNHVICPLHAWKIDLITGEAAAPDKGCVLRFPVDVRDGEVFVDVSVGLPDGGLRPLAEVVGAHCDNGRPKLGGRRAQPPDFTLHDFDREIPVLAVEPPSPENEETLQLSITGLDGPERVLTLDDIKSRYEVFEAPAHITCLMFGFTRPVTWTAVRLADVLEDLGAADAPFASFFSWDTSQTAENERFFETLPNEYFMDPRALLAFGMNGGPLPKEHGGPLRLALPFLQGYKSVKWLTWIKLTEQDEVGYKKLHGFINFPEFVAPEGFGREERHG